MATTRRYGFGKPTYGLPGPNPPRNAAGGLKVTGLHAATRKPSGERQNRKGSNFDGRALACDPLKCGHHVYWGPSTLKVTKRAA